MAADPEYTQVLARGVIQQAYEAGLPGSPEYAAAYQAGIANLQNIRSTLWTMIDQNLGKHILSVQAGETVTWATPILSVQDQYYSVIAAIEILKGRSWKYTRTSARFMY